jgi:hypothetical protein
MMDVVTYSVIFSEEGSVSLHEVIAGESSEKGANNVDMKISRGG